MMNEATSEQNLKMNLNENQKTFYTNIDNKI
jgi:hypothetical protein